VFEEHEIEWTPEKISRLWSFRHERTPDERFSKQVGLDILRKTRKYTAGLHNTEGGVLDYGCGNGDLLGFMLDKSIPCQGADYSQYAVDAVNKKLQNHKNVNYFKGVFKLNGLPSPNLKSNYYDVVFFIETIEHIDAEDVAAVVNEIYRILKTDGIIIVTTPFEEDLITNTVMCPDCGCIFNHLQHLTTWSVQSIVEVMSGVGFESICCKSTRFLLDSNALKYFNKRIRTFIAKNILRQKMPHLLYIGRKQGADK